MSITVFIRYQLDPFKRVPHEGTNNIAFALISFESLAAYEAYRAR
jgi:NIPSNAP